MGGDFAPEAVVEGAVDSLSHLSGDDKLVLVGDQDSIHFKLKELSCDPSRFEIVHTTQVIGMGDTPSKAYSQKPDSSIAVGYRLLKENRIEGFCSAGNTGAVVSAATLFLRHLPGVERSGIALCVPNKKDFSLIFGRMQYASAPKNAAEKGLLSPAITFPPPSFFKADLNALTSETFLDALVIKIFIIRSLDTLLGPFLFLFLPFCQVVLRSLMLPTAPNQFFL